MWTPTGCIVGLAFWTGCGSGSGRDFGSETANSGAACEAWMRRGLMISNGSCREETGAVWARPDETLVCGTENAHDVVAGLVSV
jgi:hypothetical protein